MKTQELPAQAKKENIKTDDASNRIRTDDLHITSVAPYQLGHRS